MPCSDGTPPSGAYACEDTALRRSADKATRAGCDMRTILRRHALENELTVETREWIAQHDKEDARRIAQEIAAGERAVAKANAKRKYSILMKSMTLEERRVLGL